MCCSLLEAGLNLKAELLWVIRQEGYTKPLLIKSSAEI